MDRFVLFLILSVWPCLGWAMGHSTDSQVNSFLLGKSAPDMVLSSTDGNSSKVVASRGDKKAILIFWATWCSHCYEELGSLNEHRASIEARGIKLILVNVEETKEKVKQYFDRRQLKLSSFIDEDGVLMESYHIQGVPTLIFIDKAGIVRQITHQFPSHLPEV